jgi:hypothetical protein
MDDLAAHPRIDWPLVIQHRRAVRSVRDELYLLANVPGLSIDLRCDVLAAMCEADAEAAEITLRIARAQAAETTERVAAHVAAGRPLPTRTVPRPATLPH